MKSHRKGKQEGHDADEKLHEIPEIPAQDLDQESRKARIFADLNTNKFLAKKTNFKNSVNFITFIRKSAQEFRMVQTPK